jgi:lysozyme family protein
MASFQKAYDAVIVPHEGGYASAATAASIGDSGGETYKGVARNYNPTWAGWAIIDAYKAQYGVPKWNSYIPSPTLDKLVLDLAKKEYWDKNRLGEVLQQPIANLLMDITYNSGPVQAALTVQRVLDIADDGIVGLQTITAINKADPVKLLTDLVAYRKSWLSTHLAGKTFLTTLLNRTQSYMSGIKDLVTGKGSVIIPLLLLAGLTAFGIHQYKKSQK